MGGVGLAISLGRIVLLIRASSRSLWLMGDRSRSRHVIRHYCWEEGDGKFCDVQKLVRIHRMKEQAGSDRSACLGNGE